MDLLKGQFAMEDISKNDTSVKELMTKFIPREQVLFDHLIKLYKDAKWEDAETIVLPSLKIKITPPFDASSCDALDGSNNRALERVKKIVAKLWEKNE